MKKALSKIKVSIYVLTAIFFIIFLLYLISYKRIYENNSFLFYKINDAIYSDYDSIKNDVELLDFVDALYFEKYIGTLSSSYDEEIHSLSNYDEMLLNKNIDLLYGRFPKNEDEILITSLDYIDNNILTLSYGFLDCNYSMIYNGLCTNKIEDPETKTYKIVGVIKPFDNRVKYYTYSKDLNDEDKGSFIIKVKPNVKNLSNIQKEKMILLQKKYNKDLINCFHGSECFKYNETFYSNIHSLTDNNPTLKNNNMNYIYNIIISILLFMVIFILEYMYFSKTKNKFILKYLDSLSIIALGLLLSLFIINIFMLNNHKNVLRDTGIKKYTYAYNFIDQDIDIIKKDVASLKKNEIVFIKDNTIEINFNNYKGEINLYKYALKKDIPLINISKLEKYNPYYVIKYNKYFETYEIYKLIISIVVIILIIINKNYYKPEEDMVSFRVMPIIVIDEKNIESKKKTRKNIKKEDEEITDDSHGIIYIKTKEK